MARFISSVKSALKLVPNCSKSDSTNLSLKVVSKFGVGNVEVPSGDYSSEVKEQYLTQMRDIGKFPEADISMDIISKYWLIRIKIKKKVADDMPLGQQGIESKEELVMIESRDHIDHPYEHVYLGGPSIQHIFERTMFIPRKGCSKRPYYVTHLMLTDDMRKAFVTLAQESSYMLGMTRYAGRLISFYRQRIHYFIKHSKNLENVLMKLGFDEERVKKALLLSGNNGRMALEWLIDHDPTFDDTSLSTAPDSRRDSKSPRSSIVTSDRPDSILSSKFIAAINHQKRIEGLLEIVNFYSEKPELIYEDNINYMKFLGYSAEEAQNALSVTRNNIASAIAYIHGDSSPSVTELRDGFAEDSEIRRLFMESPEILEGLAKPEVFVFLVCILDNPAQANGWNPFSDIGILMTHMITTYHENKHVLAINQFNGSRLAISALSAPSLNID